MALLFTLAACASDAKSSINEEPMPAGGAATTGPQVSPADTVAVTLDSTRVSTASDSSVARLKPDTAPARIEVASVKGRSKKDSIALVSAVRAGKKDTRWPVRGPALLPGSILPGRRIVAYYGNPLSKKMGILGEIPSEQMLARLDKEVAAWQKADPSTPVQPALHLVAVVAQGAPGKDGKYKLRMADSLIDRVSQWAATRNALVFLDVQISKSTLQAEVPRLEAFLKRPNVHLGVDPEFSMKTGHKPGERIGTMSAADINYVVGYLSNLVKANNLPPKVLVVHRFTRGMVTETKSIKLDPRVQVVMHMDGWGAPWLKYDSYRDYVQAEPVQFTGFKLFYQNDTKKGDPLLTPPEILQLHPKPVYIQYQ